eukprot:g9476.t1
MFHPSHWFHTHKHNKCLFPFDVCAFKDYKGKHANRELSFKRGDIIQVSGQCQDDGGNPIDVPRKPTKLSSGIMDVNYPVYPGTDSGVCWIGKLVKFTPDGGHYASHDIGHFPVDHVMLQSDYAKYMKDGIDPRPKRADDDTEGLQQKEEAATKIQALHRGNAERKKGKHHTRVIVFQEGSLGVGIDPPEELDVGAIITEVAEGKQGEELGVEEDWAIQCVGDADVSNKPEEAERLKAEEAEKAKLKDILPEYNDTKSRQKHDFDIFFKAGDVGIEFSVLNDQIVVDRVVPGGQAYMVGIIEKGNILTAIDKVDVMQLKTIEKLNYALGKSERPCPFIFRPTAEQIKEKEDRQAQAKAIALRRKEKEDAAFAKEMEDKRNQEKMKIVKEHDKAQKRLEKEHKRQEEKKAAMKAKKMEREKAKKARQEAARKKLNDQRHREVMETIRKKQEAAVLDGFGVGKKVSVWWPRHKNTFPGKVKEIDSDQNIVIVYDHGPEKAYTLKHLESLVHQAIEHEHLDMLKRKQKKQLRSAAADAGLKLNGEYELYDVKEHQVYTCKLLRIGDDAEGLVVQLKDGTLKEYLLEEMCEMVDKAKLYKEEEKRLEKQAKKLGYKVGSKISVWFPVKEKAYSGTIAQFFHTKVKVEYDDGDVNSYELEELHQRILKAKEVALEENNLQTEATESGIMPGAKVDVWWPSKGKVYVGTVHGYAGLKVHIKYLDGDERLYKLEELIDRMEAAVVEKEKLRQKQVEAARQRKEKMLEKKREKERLRRLQRIEEQKKRKEEIRQAKIREQEEEERRLLEAIAAEEAEKAREAELERRRIEAEEAEIRRFKRARQERIMYNEDTTNVRDSSMQTDILPPAGKVKTPKTSLKVEEVIKWHKDGIALLHKAYCSKCGINKLGNTHRTFERMGKINACVDKEAFLQMCNDFSFCSIKNRRIDGRGAKLKPSNKSWYKLWSEIPLVYKDIIEANLAEIDKISEEIGLGNAVFASSAMAQIEYASEDPRIPPKLSFEGVLPILKNEVIEIFNKAAGKKFAFRHLPLENFDKALVALAYKGVRRAVPTPAFVRSCYSSVSSRAAFHNAVRPPSWAKPFRFSFCHWLEYPLIWSYVTQNRVRASGREFMKNSPLEERDAAAVIIQAMIRGMTHRSLRRRKYLAAQEIQRHIRGKLQRLRFPRALAIRRAVAEMVAVNRIASLRPAQCLMAVMERSAVGSANQLKRQLMHANRGFVYGEFVNSKVEWTEEQLDFDLLGDEKRESKIDMDSLFVGSYEGGLMSTSGSWKDEEISKAIENSKEGGNNTVLLPVIHTENVVNEKGEDGNWLDTLGVHGPPEENEDVLKHMKEDHQKLHQKLHEKHKDHSFGGHGFKMEIHRGDIIPVTWNTMEEQDALERQRRRRKVRQPFSKQGDGMGSNNAEANMFTPGYAPATPPQVSWEQIQSVDMADVDKAYNKNFIEGRTRAVRPRYKKQENKQGSSPTIRQRKASFVGKNKRSPVAQRRRLKVSLKKETRKKSSSPRRPEQTKTRNFGGSPRNRRK